MIRQNRKGSQLGIIISTRKEMCRQKNKDGIKAWIMKNKVK